MSAGLTILLIIFLSLSFQESADDLEVFPCPRNTLPANEVDGDTVVCGQLTVPENYESPTAQSVTIPFIIFKAKSSTPQPDPVVYILGGPGGWATPFPAFTFRENFRRFREHRDFIIYDQRGNGNSAPSLDCPAALQRSFAVGSTVISPEDREADMLNTVLECQESFDELDLTQYNSAVNARDLNGLRLALGYGQWNVFGVSYGSKLALTLMRDYPNGIRSVILDSVYPLQVNLFTGFASNRQQAYDHFFSSCAVDVDCAAAYPDLEEQFYALLGQLDDMPISFRARHSFQGFLYDARVDGYVMDQVLFQALYNPVEDLPKLIDEVANGEISGLIARVETFLNAPVGISEGNYWSVQCREEAPFENAEVIRSSMDTLHPAVSEYVGAGLDASIELCEEWNTESAPSLANEPVISLLPTLIVSGGYDPVTPASWAAIVHEDLTNSRFYVFPPAGHGAINDSVCAAEIAEQFIDDPEGELDTSCLDGLKTVFSMPTQ